MEKLNITIKMIKAKKDGLLRHHIDEDKVDSLNKRDNWNKYPEYQKANRLIYCSYEEHIILHLKIFEEGKEKLIYNINKLIPKTQKKLWN